MFVDSLVFFSPLRVLLTAFMEDFRGYLVLILSFCKLITLQLSSNQDEFIVLKVVLGGEPVNYSLAFNESLLLNLIQFELVVF